MPLPINGAADKSGPLVLCPVGENLCFERSSFHMSPWMSDKRGSVGVRGYSADIDMCKSSLEVDRDKDLCVVGAIKDVVERSSTGKGSAACLFTRKWKFQMFRTASPLLGRLPFGCATTPLCAPDVLPGGVAATIAGLTHHAYVLYLRIGKMY